MFYKLIDEKTKKVDVGLGTNIEFYKSIGMVEGEVEQGYDGAYYLKGYAPQKTLEELKTEKIEELRKERNIYKSKTFIREGFSLLDFEPFSCYNYFNLIRLKMGWKKEELDKFDEEHEFISNFWDTKKKEIKEETNKTKLVKINVVFKKEEQK